MTLIEFARAFLNDAPVGVVITDAQYTRPGPVILYANLAFGTMTGHRPADLVGLTPRFMQGRETRRSVLDEFARALAASERYHGFLTNYRSDGTKYRTEIDCRPFFDNTGSLTSFIAFEREVTRRVGRPGPGRAGRYDPVAVSNDLLTGSLASLGLFGSDRQAS